MTEEIDGNDTDLSVRSVKQIGHNSTQHGRITDDAAIRVAFEEQRRLSKLFSLAETLAIKEGRKTVKEEDIRAVRQLLSEELPL